MFAWENCFTRVIIRFKRVLKIVLHSSLRNQGFFNTKIFQYLKSFLLRWFLKITIYPFLYFMIWHIWMALRVHVTHLWYHEFCPRLIHNIPGRIYITYIHRFCIYVYKIIFVFIAYCKGLRFYLTVTIKAQA